MTPTRTFVKCPNSGGEVKWIVLAFVGFFVGCTSMGSKNMEIEPKRLGTVKESALGLIQKDHYDIKSISLGETTFHLMGRKKDGIGLPTLESCLRKMWPHFAKHFRKAPVEAAIIDFDAPIGGGPLAPFIIGVFYSKDVSKDHQKVILESTGWLPQSSTSAYIAKNYSSFSNPEEAYVDDMLTHEFGHLFFGWGLTQVNAERPNDWWFSFGMGLIYDRIAWSDVYRLPSPLFDSVIATWINDFSKRQDVDQRLINPDTSADKANGLQRLQTYGHGKAYKYLLVLRDKVGAEIFDRTANVFISDELGRKADYDNFVKRLPVSVHHIVGASEKEFSIR